MNILVINGSPKGTNSITLQTVLYLEKCFPEHRFRMLHVGAKIKTLEKDLTPALQELKEQSWYSFPIRFIRFWLPASFIAFSNW